MACSGLSAPSRTGLQEAELRYLGRNVPVPEPRSACSDQQIDHFLGAYLEHYVLNACFVVWHDESLPAIKA
jgi:hypothetical protein